MKTNDSRPKTSWTRNQGIRNGNSSTGRGASKKFPIMGFRLFCLLFAMILSSTLTTYGQMYVQGRNLKAPNGQTVLLRGVNRMNGWNDYGQAQYNFIFSEIAKSGSNTVRIQWNANSRTVAELDEIVTACANNKMIPMVALFDGTVKPLSVHYNTFVNWWTRPDVVAMVNKHKNYFLLNICNEPTGSDSEFFNLYRSAIIAIRNAGITVPIVLDGFNGGQNADVCMSQGPALLAVDPNLIFSVHAYWPNGFNAGWSGEAFGDTYINNKTQQMYNSGLCFVFGEFANLAWYCGTTVNHNLIMQRCQQYGMGYYAWSWDNNNGDCAEFNMVGANSTYASVTRQWAKDVLWVSPYSIQNTSIIAPMFTGGGGTVAVTSVSVTPTTVSLSPGGTQQLTATVLPTNATNKIVSWSSSNTAVATVNSSGLVTAVAAGSATITVTTQDGNKTATCAVTVTSQQGGTTTNYNNTDLSFSAGWNYVSGLTDGRYLGDEHYTFTAGSSYTFAFTGNQIAIYGTRDSHHGTANVSIDGGASTTISYHSTTRGVDQLIWTSPVLAQGNHTITVTAVSSAVIVADRIVVYSNPTTVAVSSVSLSPSSATVQVGATQQLTATVLPTNATNKTVSWSSNNTAVATVNSSGLVTAVAAGSATITVTTQDGNKTATCAITVPTPTVSVTSVSVTPTTVSLSPGGTQQLTATVLPTNATNKTVSWSSNNTAVATVNSIGLVTAVAAGSATITVTTQDGNKTATCAVTVTSQQGGTTTNYNNTDLSFSAGWNYVSGLTDGRYLGDEHYTFTAGSSYTFAFTGNQIAIYGTRDSHHGTANVSIDGGASTTISYHSATRGVDQLIWTSPVLAQGNHTITVTAVSSAVIVADRIVVYSNPTTVAVSSVSLSPSSATVQVGATQQLTATVLPTNATNKTVSWSSNNTAVATVNSSGLVTAVAAGSATITVTTQDGNKTATCAITVSAAGGTNLVANPGFESDGANWTIQSPFTVSTLDKYAGTKSLRVPGAGAWKVAHQTITVLPNTNYILSAYMKGSAQIFIKVFTANWSAGLGERFVSPTGSWVKYSLEFNSGNNTQIVITFMDSGSGTTYIDNVELIKDPNKSAYVITGIEDITVENTMIYPNPAKDNLSLGLPADVQDAQVAIFSLDGKMLKQVNNLYNGATIDLNGINSGLYLVRVTAKDKTVVLKCVVNKN